MRELVTGEVVTAACEQIIRRFPDYVEAERTRGVDAAVGWVITGTASTSASSSPSTTAASMPGASSTPSRG